MIVLVISKTDETSIENLSHYDELLVLLVPQMNIPSLKEIGLVVLEEIFKVFIIYGMTAILAM